MKISQHNLSLQELMQVDLNWNLVSSSDGKFLQIINGDGLLVAAVAPELKNVARMLVTTPKIIDSLSRCVIILSNPELYPAQGEMAINYAASVLKSCVGELQ